MARSIYQGDNYDKVYKLDNYMIRYDEENRNSGICAIYCSSSGLYFPNTEEEFCKAFIERTDNFEWKKHLIQSAYKHIWIRDITKEFYVRGINAEVNSIEKLIEFLKDATDGLRVVLIGSSGGGYIASLLGCVLHAKVVYCFSGFFNLNVLDEETWPLIKTEPYVSAYKNKWYDLSELIRESGVDILYFYPGKLRGDIEQASYVQDIKNVHKYCFRSSVHGVPFSDQSALDMLLNSDSEYIMEKLKFFEGKRISCLIWKVFFWFMKKKA